MRFRMPFGARAALTAVVALLTFVPAAMAVDEVNTTQFRKAVTVNGILQHERALQTIANANDGTRASGTPGFDASVAYVKSRLNKAGYDGDGSDTPTAGPPGSAQIENIFNSYYASQGLAVEPTAFDGRSDYGPFIATGVPAGGLFSGAEGEKTPDEAATYGGTAGQPYDSCYHQACDTASNLSSKALFELGDGVAHATLTLARTKTGFFEDGSKRRAKARKHAVTYYGSQSQR